MVIEPSSKLARGNDFLIASFVVVITTLLLLPLPTWLLDILLVLNLSVSLLLLLVGLYMPNALALLAFPTLLLLTTLFRLGLNVASTRLILSQADAGLVIQAFGTLLIRGEVVVGVIIFTIITVVNYIVVAKGSARVSEVAARFALDALPGRQMSIDADLRAGLVTPQQAEDKREDLRKESQLFGSMDGAMKFVQGDAIAGVFIIFTNILGGLYLGMSHGMELGQAVQTYTTLTVGDGLVSQIPSLLVSICAGIVVTRIASEKDSTLGRDVTSQLFARPGTIVFAGGLLLVLGLFSSLPVIPFLIIGLVFIAFGLYLRRGARRGERRVAVRSPGHVGLLPGPTPDVQSSLLASGKALQFEFDPIFYDEYRRREQAHLKWFESLRSAFFESVGIGFPSIEVNVIGDASAGKTRVRYNGVPIVECQLPYDAQFVEMSPQWADQLGITVLQRVLHPMSGTLAMWAPSSSVSDEARRSLRVLDFFQFTGVASAAYLRKHPEDILSLNDVYLRLKAMETGSPGFLSEALHSEFLSVSRITEVLQQFVREGGNVHQFETIIEHLAGYVSHYGARLISEDEFHVEDVVGYLRIRSRRQMFFGLFGNDGPIRAITMSESCQDAFSRVRTDDPGAPLRFDSVTYRGLREGLRKAIFSLQERGLPPLAVLCPSEIRYAVTRFLLDEPGFIHVLVPDELDPARAVAHAAVWGV